MEKLSEGTGWLRLRCLAKVSFALFCFVFAAAVLGS